MIPEKSRWRRVVDFFRSGATPRERRIGSFGELIGLWREDFASNRRALFRPGFQAVAVYRFGVWVDGVQPTLVRWPLRRVYLALHVMVRNLYGIEIYYTVRAGRRLRVGHQSGIVIGNFVTLGDDCLIRQNVTIGVAREGEPRERAPVIGDRVEFGAGAVVLSPARIGDDALIGPNVVVRSDVAANSVALPQPPEVRVRKRPDPSPEDGPEDQ